MKTARLWPACLHEDRWPSVLQKALGPEVVRVIAEGLNGRTTAYDDSSGGLRPQWRAHAADDSAHACADRSRDHPARHQ
jgi:lysophospholipase L1-like esterase